ncbi:glycoside hydrolase family 16 protein [Geodermatophilus sp. SYSU D00758]
MQHGTRRYRHGRRTFVGTSILALVIAGGGVVGGLTAEPAAETAEETALAQAGWARQWTSGRWDRDGLRSERQVRSDVSGWRSSSREGDAAEPPSPTAGEQPVHESTTARSAGAAARSTSPDQAAPATAEAAAPTPSATGGSTTPGASAAGFASVEEFATPVPAGTWPSNGQGPSAYPDYMSYPDGTSEKYYPSEVLSVHDGVLDWHVHDGKAAAVLPFGYEGFTYGTYTVRMRTDNFPGYHIAFLLWPNTDQWTHELDGPEGETGSSHPYPAVLQSTDPVRFAPAQTTPVPHSWNDPGFHNYTWQWGPDFVAFYQDGTLVTRVTGNVPQQGMHPVLQVEFSNTLSEGQKPDRSVSGHVLVNQIIYDPPDTNPDPID